MAPGPEVGLRSSGDPGEADAGVSRPGGTSRGGGGSGVLWRDSDAKGLRPDPELEGQLHHQCFVLRTQQCAQLDTKRVTCVRDADRPGAWCVHGPDRKADDWMPYDQ